MFWKTSSWPKRQVRLALVAEDHDLLAAVVGQPQPHVAADDVGREAEHVGQHGVDVGHVAGLRRGRGRGPRRALRATSAAAAAAAAARRFTAISVITSYVDGSTRPSAVSTLARPCALISRRSASPVASLPMRHGRRPAPKRASRASASVPIAVSPSASWPRSRARGGGRRARRGRRRRRRPRARRAGARAPLRGRTARTRRVVERSWTMTRPSASSARIGSDAGQRRRDVERLAELGAEQRPGAGPATAPRARRG